MFTQIGKILTHSPLDEHFQHLLVLFQISNIYLDFINPHHLHMDTVRQHKCPFIFASCLI